MTRKTKHQASNSRVSFLHLQKTIGNQEVNLLLKSGAIQAKLTVSYPADSAEKEADRVADDVMRMKEPEVQKKEDTLMPQEDLEEEELLQGKLMRQPEEEEELQAKFFSPAYPEIQTKSNNSAKFPNLSGIEAQINSSKGTGSKMDDSTRQFMESRFGNDFADVRIHTGSQASQLNHSINARAFTTGRDIYFREGQYNTKSTDGKKLLAHELTHSIQQTGGNQKITRRVLQQSDYKAQDKRSTNFMSSFAEVIQGQKDDNNIVSSTKKNNVGIIHRAPWENQKAVFEADNGLKTVPNYIYAVYSKNYLRKRPGRKGFKKINQTFAYITDPTNKDKKNAKKTAKIGEVDWFFMLYNKYGEELLGAVKAPKEGDGIWQADTDEEGNVLNKTAHAMFKVKNLNKKELLSVF